MTVLLWDGLKREIAHAFMDKVYEMYMPLAVYGEPDRPRKVKNVIQMNWPKQLEEELYRENTEKVDALTNSEESGKEIGANDPSVESVSMEESVGYEEENLHEENSAEEENVSLKPISDLLSAEYLDDYEKLIKDFYIIDGSTEANRNIINVRQFLEEDLSIEKTEEGPQILIYHTHSKEGFLDSDPADLQTGIVGVGEELTRILQEEFGYSVLHHQGEYDKETRDDAYSKALPEIQKLLEEYPTIRVVIDLHRDEMPKQTRLVTEINGKKTARFMFFNGLSRTKKTGPLEYLNNEYQTENLAFSFQMKLLADTYYPNLARKNYLKGYRYNMHVCPRTLLVELGAQNNTYEEAVNACEPLAHLLDMVLSGNG